VFLAFFMWGLSFKISVPLLAYRNLGYICLQYKKFGAPFFRSGGIIGLGEAEEDRVGLLHTLATLPAHPESVPINALVAVKGTPLEDQKVFCTVHCFFTLCACS
jgi:hypothetical protein